MFDLISTYSHRDLEWFASDREGHVGFFATSASAPVHKVGVEFVVKAAIEISRFVNSLPETSDVDINPIMQRIIGGERTCREVLERGGELPAARRGIFAFDTLWQEFFPSPYILTVKPRKPLRVKDFPLELQHMLARLQVQHLRFGECLHGFNILEPDDLGEEALLSQEIRSIKRVADLLLHLKDWRATKEVLIAEGIAPSTAMRAVLFLPIACARYHFREVTGLFSNVYFNEDSGKEEQVSHDLVYRAAWKFVAEKSVNEAGRGRCDMLAAHSAEYIGINSMLANGSQLSDLRLGALSLQFSL